MVNPALTQAVAAWRKALGVAHVLDDPDELGAAGLNTFDLPRAIVTILRPGSAADVQACLRVANEYRVPVYPVSRGRNWGLGSRVPTAPGCALLDLARLDRIVDYDEKLATLTVEPGVTFQQGYDFLRERQSPLFLSTIGGPPDSSLIANALERGDGDGPLGDRANHVAALEVVLPTGEFLRTGLGRYAGASAAALHRPGVGPDLDGLFFQSNLGVVTRMSLWLAAKPAYYHGFTFRVADEPHMASCIDALRALYAEGIAQGNWVTLWNGYKMLARQGRYPWAATGGVTPLSLGARHGVEPWFGTGILHAASPAMMEAQRERVQAQLGGHVAELSFVDADDLAGAGQVAEPGVPSDANVRTAYWRKRTDTPESMDLDRDRCGVIWLCPVLPFDGEAVSEALRTMARIGQEYALEPHIGMAPSTMRCMRVYVSIVYDRDVDGEDARAMACHDAMLEKLISLGHYPYRLGIHEMGALPGSRDGYVALLRDLKRQLDPNDILAPGRYDFRDEW